MLTRLINGERSLQIKLYSEPGIFLAALLGNVDFSLLAKTNQET